MVLGKELENNSITSRNTELVRLEDETTRATNLDGMASTCSRNSSSLALANCGCTSRNRNGSLLMAAAGGNSLGNGDLLVDVCSLCAATRVCPDDDDVAASIESKTVATHAVEYGNGASIQLGFGLDGPGNGFDSIYVANLVRQSEGREGQRDRR